MEHQEEGYSHSRYPPRDYSGPGDRGPRDYEGHNMERGRGRGFVSSELCSVHFVFCFFFFFTEVLTSRLLAILCPDGITVDCASLLCSLLLILRIIMWVMMIMMTLLYIVHQLPDYFFKVTQCKPVELHHITKLMISISMSFVCVLLSSSLGGCLTLTWTRFIKYSSIFQWKMCLSIYGNFESTCCFDFSSPESEDEDGTGEIIQATTAMETLSI